MSGEEKPKRPLNAGGAGEPGASEVSPETGLAPELRAIEARLASLRPRTDRLDRERLMFLAGQAAATEPSHGARGAARRWIRQAASMAAAAAAAAVLTLWVWQPEPKVVERLVYVPIGQEPARPVRPQQAAARPETPGHPRAVPHAGLPGVAFARDPDMLLADGLKGDAFYLRRLDRALSPRPLICRPAPAPGEDVQPEASGVLTRQSLDGLLEELTGLEMCPDPLSEPGFDRGAKT